RTSITDRPENRRGISSSRTIQSRKVWFCWNNSLPIWKYCDPWPENMNTVSEVPTQHLCATALQPRSAADPRSSLPAASLTRDGSIHGTCQIPLLIEGLGQ